MGHEANFACGVVILMVTIDRVRKTMIEALSQTIACVALGLILGTLAGKVTKGKNNV